TALVQPTTTSPSTESTTTKASLGRLAFTRRLTRSLSSRSRPASHPPSQVAPEALSLPPRQSLAATWSTALLTRTTRDDTRGRSAAVKIQTLYQIELLTNSAAPLVVRSSCLDRVKERRPGTTGATELSGSSTTKDNGTRRHQPPAT